MAIRALGQRLPLLLCYGEMNALLELLVDTEVTGRAGGSYVHFVNG